MRNKTRTKLFKIFMLLSGLYIILSPPLFSQNKTAIPRLQNYYTLSPTGDASNPMLTSVQPPSKQFSTEKSEILDRLENARIHNDVIAKEKAERELDQLSGSVTVSLSDGQEGTPTAMNIFTEKNNPPFEPDYNTIPVNTGSDPWAVTTCTNPPGFPNPGRIWCVYTAYNANTTDTLKTAYSDNGGTTWVQYASVNYGNQDVKFRASELKCIPVFDGSNMLLFIVAGYDFNGNKFSALYRYNITASSFFPANLGYPGQVVSYNPRICTDNENYPLNEYVYLLSSTDSITTGGNSDVRQKFAILTSPAATSPTITYRSPGTFGGGFWWHTSVVTNTYLSSDIAYYKDYGGTSNSRVMTVWNVNYGTGSLSNLYLAWSDDYGVSNAGNLSLTSTLVTRGARIAFNSGGTTVSPNRNGMITFFSDYSGADWDYLSFNTTTGGTTTGTWAAKSIDFTSNHASGRPDVIAVRNGANLFKATYTEDATGPRGYYSSFNGTTWLANPYDVTGTGVDTSYTGINPGYKNGGGDDNIAFYSKVGGTGDIGVYCSNNIVSTVGIHNNNNDIPKSYSLFQNYPNPFNPATNIKFDIPVNSFVKLSVFDITGREIAVLINRELNAGSYNTSFDASNISSGVYFCKIQSNEFTSVKKMLLVK